MTDTELMTSVDPKWVEQLKHGTDIDAEFIDQMEKVVRTTAEMICAEQPDVPKPDSLYDLDSFSMVQILLELENTLQMKLLERLDGFEGTTFRDVGEFIIRMAQEDDALARGVTLPPVARTGEPTFPEAAQASDEIVIEEDDDLPATPAAAPAAAETDAEAAGGTRD
jgi:hypothetical protein